MRINVTLNTKETESLKVLAASIKDAATITGFDKLVSKGKAATEKVAAMFGIRKKDFNGSSSQEIKCDENGVHYSYHLGTKQFCALVKVAQLAAVPAFTAIRDMTNWGTTATSILDEATVECDTFVNDETGEKNIFIGKGVVMEMLEDLDPTEYKTIFLRNQDDYDGLTRQYFMRLTNVKWGFDYAKAYDETYPRKESEEVSVDESLSLKDKLKKSTAYSLKEVECNFKGVPYDNDESDESELY